MQYSFVTVPPAVRPFKCAHKWDEMWTCVCRWPWWVPAARSMRSWWRPSDWGWKTPREKPSMKWAPEVQATQHTWTFHFHKFIYIIDLSFTVYHMIFPALSFYFKLFLVSLVILALLCFCFFPLIQTIQIQTHKIWTRNTLFCLFQIKKHSYLTSCVFGFLFLSTNSVFNFQIIQL